MLFQGEQGGDPSLPKSGAYYAQAILKSAFLCVCVFMAFGGYYPPVNAQQVIPVLTVEDALQDNNIHSLNEHLNATDATVKAQWAAITANTLAIAGIQAEERIIGVALGLLSSAGFFIKVRTKA